MAYNGYTVDEMAALDLLTNFKERVAEAIRETNYDGLVSAINYMRASLGGQYTEEALDEFENEALADWDEAHTDSRLNSAK